MKAVGLEWCEYRACRRIAADSWIPKRYQPMREPRSLVRPPVFEQASPDL